MTKQQLNLSPKVQSVLNVLKSDTSQMYPTEYIAEQTGLTVNQVIGCIRTIQKNYNINTNIIKEGNKKIAYFSASGKRIIRKRTFNTNFQKVKTIKHG